MNEAKQSAPDVLALASYLNRRRDHILKTWQTEVTRDPRLANASVLSRAQFYDHIPAMLDLVETSVRLPKR